jgi:hypothetical protein
MMPLLEIVSDLVARQRAAILARDRAMLQRLELKLAALLPALEETLPVEAGKTPVGEAAHIKQAAQRVHDAIRANQVLLRGGIAASDHFARCCAEAARSPDAGLFTGVC